MSDSHYIKDADQRERALNPEQSFIVQAPAGSGKTELLTQRFLLLLSKVNQPEEILAITFTKKAAAEMRARIIKSLKKATEPDPTLLHEKKTWQLAVQALTQDKLLNWNLLENPNRLRIQTIDSFNASLIKYLPILSHFGAPPEITDFPEPLYQQAVQEFLNCLEDEVEWADAIAQLLNHLDNDLNKVQELLINMLSKRDQWMPYVIKDNEDVALLRVELEETLAAIVTDTLNQLQNQFPAEHVAEILALARYAAENLRLTTADHPIVSCLDLFTFPEAVPEHKPIWLGISELLLTEANEWRKQSNKKIGFPPPSEAKGADKIKFKEMKLRHENLLEKLSQLPELHTALVNLIHSPDSTYDENQWEMLRALLLAFKVVVGILKLVFREHSKIDYIENSQAALHALGDEESPTDLALALDYQIKHILLDEFQDTSNNQYRLIEKLTAGWQPYDGRSLFIVGDPMQSIYRFREADVGLFLRARSHGIGHVRLEPLTLAVNFRSTPTVVEWVNQHFSRVLPPHHEVATGAVAYSHSTANQTNITEGSTVKLHAITDRNNQAEALVTLIKDVMRQKPNGSIAILVRARAHLKFIIPALNAAKLSFRAIKIDPLSARPVIQDLIALTRALQTPADKVAWMAILRAPWCGLSLSDLLQLEQSGDDKTILESLQTTKLSPDGQIRLARILPVLNRKIAERQRYTLHQWVESTWLSLGGPACLVQSAELDDAKAFFHLLDELDEGGTLPNLANLTRAVAKLFAAPDNQADANLQIMTIHNAKGLEFDTVILPHLEKSSRKDDKQLLLWMEKSDENAASSLVLAPLPATGARQDLIYDYIKLQNTTKATHETGRLLYVAATRAKQQLHLFFSPVRSLSGSLLNTLRPALTDEIPKYESDDSENENSTVPERPISRLVSSWENPVREILPEALTKHQKMPGFKLSQNNARLTGTLVHKILENIAKSGIAWWQQQSAKKRDEYVKAQLKQAGVLTPDIHTEAELVHVAINNTLQDTRGQWILHPHAEAETEVALTALIDGTINQLVIDRTFVDDDGVRWIIDYKTARHESGLLENFLDREYAEYAGKMSLYHQAMTQRDEKKPIKLGLYFPLIPAWKTWEIN